MLNWILLIVLVVWILDREHADPLHSGASDSSSRSERRA